MAAVFTQLLSSRRFKSHTPQKALAVDGAGAMRQHLDQKKESSTDLSEVDDDIENESALELHGGSGEDDDRADNDGGNDDGESSHGDEDSGEEEEEDDDDDEDTIRISKNTRQLPARAGEQNSSRRRRSADQDTASQSIDDKVAIASDASSSAEESSEAEQWEEASEGQDAIESENADVARCMFCHETEEDDPGEEFEEILSCISCGDNAHRQCAREEDVFSNEDGMSHLWGRVNDDAWPADQERTDAARWRCAKCLDSEEDSSSDASGVRQRRTSAPKFARDLLPPQNVVDKEGSHSIFNKLILDDDPMDGSRSLRKRKASGESEEGLIVETRKRLRRFSEKPAEEAVDDEEDDEDDDESDIDMDDLQTDHKHDDIPRPRHPRGIRNEHDHENPSARVILDTEGSLVMCFKLNHNSLAAIKDEARKKRKRERERERQRRIREGKHQPGSGQPISTAGTSAPTEPAHYPSIQVSNIATPFFALHDREGEGEKSKPYGGILTEEEANTERTFPDSVDRKRFEDARQKAEELWRRKVEAANVQEQIKPAHKLSGPPSRIKCISFGDYEIDTWHAAPYPEEYSRNRILYICEFCLKYLNSDFVAWRHKLKCPARHPPGDEIYSDGSFSFFEVDGRKNPVYCQNLCLLAKLFLGSKTLYYDVEPFLFYIMTENDEYGCHFVGYFSKEKRPSSQNNVSCILVLPIHQRRGFGHFLIDFSYLLTRVEKKTGSPEKPLSDMGLVSYRSYWRLVLCYQLLDQSLPLSIMDISDRTGMTPDDIVSALEGLRALVRDPVTKTYAFRLDKPFFKQYIEDYEKKGYPKINSEALIWVPYVMGRDNMHYESGAPLHTVAQREDLEEAVADLKAEGAALAQNGVSERDYASKVNGDTEGEPSVTGTDVDTGKEDEDPSTPFPTLSTADDIANDSATPTNAPSTPRANGHATDGDAAAASPIPPGRFEVFPPVPGSGARRRPGRPFGSRSHKRQTPTRSPWSTLPNGTGEQGGANAHSPTATAALSPGRMSARRTRSSLGLVELTSGTARGGKDGDALATGSPLKNTNAATRATRGGRDGDGEDADNEQNEEDEDEGDEEAIVV